MNFKSILNGLYLAVVIHGSSSGGVVSNIKFIIVNTEFELITATTHFGEEIGCFKIITNVTNREVQLEGDSFNFTYYEEGLYHLFLDGIELPISFIKIEQDSPSKFEIEKISNDKNITKMHGFYFFKKIIDGDRYTYLPIQRFQERTIWYYNGTTEKTEIYNLEDN